VEKGILVPIALFLCVTYGVKLLIDARMRWLMMHAGTEEQLRALLAGEAQARTFAALRWGVVLVALGVAFGLIHLIGWREVTPGAIALLAGATGLGNLAYFALARRAP
jgi:hypothetical protein